MSEDRSAIAPRSDRERPRVLRRLAHAARRRRLLRTVSGSLLLQGCAAGLSFTTAIVLARLLGVHEYGIYAYGVAWAGLLGAPAVLGLDRFLIRGIAMYEVRSGWGLMKGLLFRAHQAVLAASLALALIAGAIGGLLLNPSVRLAFWLALGLVPIIALTTVRQAAMQGFNQVVRGQLPDSLIRPVLLMTAVLGAALVGADLKAPSAMALNLCAALLAFFVGLVLLRQALPPQLKAASPQYDLRMWAASALTLTIASGLQVMNPHLTQVLLGSIDGPASVGVYFVVAKAAGVLTFLLLAVNLSIAPRVARLHARGQTEELQGLITRVTKRAALMTLPLCIGLILLRGPYLQLFGDEFHSGGDALIIMACAQLVNVATGSVAVILMMTGHERDAGIAIALGFGMTVAFGALLIPPLGIEGAALAYASSIVTWNLTMLALVHRRLGIHASAFGDLSHWRRRLKRDGALRP